MGYAGGAKVNPTYYSLGDHSETIQIDYDPTKVSYEQLLDLFWHEHSPTSRPYSRQYMSAIFYHNAEQKRLALKTKEREEARLKKKVYTEILPFSRFYLAEDYHQKYSLRGIPDLAKEFAAIYPELQYFVNSTAVTRVNGYAGGDGTAAQLDVEIELLGPSTAPFAKMRGKYRWQMLAKGRSSQLLHQFARKLASQLDEKIRGKGIHLDIDVDPIFIL